MFPSPCSTTTQDLLLTLNNRRLLLHSPLYYAAAPPTSNHTATTPDDYTTPANGFDANVIMVLSVLLCALFCSLGLNSIVRCALTCSTFLTRNSNNHNNNNGNNRDINSAALVGGVKKKALKTFPTVSFSVDLNLPGLDSECVICLSEFEAGERVRLLPKCNHGFHVRCIDRWLDAHSSCPTCRSCLIDTCHKIVGPCNTIIQASSSEPSPTQPRETVINITPLEHEDMIHTSSSTNS